MRIKILKLATITALLMCMLLTLFSGSETPSMADERLTSTGLGRVESLEAGYRAWEAEYIKAGGDRNMVVPMGWFKGLSTGDLGPAHGKAILNLVDGTILVEANDLAKSESYDFWLVENGPYSPVLPESDDVMVRVGSLKREGKVAKLEAKLGSEAFVNFDPDLFIITRAGKTPAEDRVIVGTTTLFHKLYRSGQRGQFGAIAGAEPQPAPADERGVFEKLIGSIMPTAEAQIGPIPNPTTAMQVLITQGRNLFFNEEFNGNGRTCGTCHREDNNLTIDVEFISTLPPNDALFVAEFTPALAANFENPVLMRKVGLILENLDGFNNPGVMRGVPHTLALLQNTLTPVAGGGDGTTTPPNERTGWSGDGAPGTGTLREFAIGAVTQHFTKRLNRVPGVDFRLPNNSELNAMEAFQRSTGRQADLVLPLNLKNEIALKGQEIFLNPGNVLNPQASNEGAGKCFFCHLNAGASDFFFPGQNANFNTNVESLPAQPADLVTPPQPNPPDGGFGGGPGPTGGFGNGTFNTPVLVEAADSGPFFHNNAVTTIEGAVDFYNSEAFNIAPGFGSLIGGIRLEATEVEAVAAFLRVINSLENIRSSVDLENRAKNATSFSQAQELLKLSIAELDDAIEVLDCAGLHPDAQRKLLAAAAIDAVALITSNQGLRNALINQAIALKNQAKSDMIN
ncbi:MAG TPA: hypothetical protein VKA70_20960 [Blastocatellia bacterium]|nr:hypothetical protein [Blastocatellia bacterium]